MPSTAKVYGILQSAPGAMVVGGKAVATLVGSDIFDDGVTITTYQVESTTNAQGEWSVDLVVNGEGKDATTTWTIELFDQFAKSVAKHDKLFIAGPADIDLGDLRRISAANATMAKDAAAVRLVTADSWAEYTAWPDNQKKPNDVILTAGV